MACTQCMPEEWTVFIMTLYSLKTSAKIITQLKMHDDILSHDRKPPTPAIQALTTASNSHQCPNSGLVCSNPVCKHTEHTINRCFKPGGGMEGQYPDWWKKKGNTNTTANMMTQKPMANMTVVQHSTASGTGEHFAFMMNTGRMEHSI